MTNMRLLTPILCVPLVNDAFQAMMALTDEERMRIFAWFCTRCGRSVGPGEEFCKHPK